MRMTKPMPEKIVTIFGTAKAGSGDEAYELAYETARLLAKSGFTIANGGYGGTMLAAAKAAVQAGGEAIGVTYSGFGAGRANEFITREIVTDSFDERLDTLVKLGQAYVVLPGGTGTLLELARVWELKNKGFLQKDKPIILLGGFWKPLVDMITADDPGSSRYVKLAADANEVKDILTSGEQNG